MLYKRLLLAVSVSVGLFMILLCCYLISLPDGIMTPSSTEILPKKEVSRLVKAGNTGDLTAIKMLFDHFSFGVRDQKEAEYWLRKGAEAGDSEFQYLLGSRLIESQSQFLVDEGISWLLAAAENGYADAGVYLGRIYSEGILVEQNNVKAAELYRMASFLGHAGAMLRLSELIENDNSITDNFAQAYAWLSVLLTHVNSTSKYAADARKKQAKIMDDLENNEIDTSFFLVQANEIAIMIESKLSLVESKK